MTLRDLDLNLLVALDRLLDRRSVSAAARDLGLSQPAASRALGRLRDVLRDPLLVPEGRGLALTDRGRALREPVRDALDAARRVFDPPAAFLPSTAAGRFVVAMGDELQLEVGAAVAVAVASATPHVDLRLTRLTAATLDESRRGEVDLAVAPDLTALPSAAGSPDLGPLIVRPVYTRRFVVAARAGTPPPDLDAFCAARHVVVSFDGGGRGFVDDLLQGLGRRRRVAASVTSFHAAAALAARTDLLATLPSEVAAARSDLATSPPPLYLPEVPVACMWHPRHTTDARHRFLRDLVAGAVREACAGHER